MGKNKNQTDLSKDEKIAYLEDQVQLYISRTSHVQTRLLSTLDTLDAIQASHQVELAKETHAKERLSEKLDRYLNLVRSAEAEKDDLQDAVIQLVEKVEISNDYSLWPHSRMRSTCLVDPIRHGLDQHLIKESEDGLRAYFSAVIASLRQAREQERKAHEQTFRDAEYRIAELEAKVARRDAELEACVAHVHQTSNSTSETEPKGQNERGRMTKEDALAVMETTTVRNKVLELEVQGLFQKLHDARKRVVSQEKPSPPSEPPATRHTHTSRDSNPSSATSHEQPTPTSHEPETRATPSRLDATEDDPTIQPNPSSQSQRRPSMSQQPQPIQDLDRQIEALATEVDAFQSERNRLAQFISKEKQTQTAEDSGSDENFSRVLLIEEECIRLANTERATRAEYESFKKAALAREMELREEAERLRGIVRDLSPRDHRAGTPPDFMGDSDGEKSMDLVTTPIEQQSEMLLYSTRPEAPESPYIDPPSIPLPPSPSPSHRPSSPPPPSLPHRSRSDSLLPISALKEERMRKVEEELEGARQDLEKKELALDELRDVVEDLQRQAQVRIAGRNADVDEDSVEDTGNLFPLDDAFH